MSVEPVSTIILALVETTHELLKKMPDYDDRKKKEFYETERMYSVMVNRPKDKRCHDTILNLKDTLLAFNKEILKGLKSA